MGILEQRAGRDGAAAVRLQPLAAIGIDPHGGLDEKMRALAGRGALPVLRVGQDLQDLGPHHPARGRRRREEESAGAVVEGDRLGDLGHGRAEHVAGERQAHGLRGLGQAIGDAALIEVPAPAAADLVQDRAELDLDQPVSLGQEVPVRGDEEPRQLGIGAQLVAGGLDLPRQRPADGDALERQAFGRRDQRGPGHPSVAGLQQGHRPDIARQAELPAGHALGQEHHRIDLLRLGVVNEAGAASAEPGARWQRHRQREIAGDGGIHRRAAAGEHVPGHQGRPRLVRRHGAREAAGLSAAEGDLQRVRVAAAAGLSRQASAEEQQ